MPLLAQYLIDRYGWRTAYIGLGVMIMLLGFSAVALFVRDPPDKAPRDRRDGAAARSDLPGMTAMEALKGSWRFRALALVILLGGISINGTLAHVVALLTDRGITPRIATATLSAAGISIILGRVGSGYFLDRLHGPYVAATSMLLAALGVALLASGAGGVVPLAGVLLCGIGVGAEIDMLGFFISRYFGLRAFAQIYGYIFPAFAIGVGLGPYFMGLCYDLEHSYAPMLVAFTVALVIDAALLACFGPYSYPREPLDKSPEREYPMIDEGATRRRGGA
jgi:MFS family permease